MIQNQKNKIKSTSKARNWLSSEQDGEKLKWKIISEGTEAKIMKRTRGRNYKNHKYKRELALGKKMKENNGFSLLGIPLLLSPMLSNHCH